MRRASHTYHIPHTTSHWSPATVTKSNVVLGTSVPPLSGSETIYNFNDISSCPRHKSLTPSRCSSCASHPKSSPHGAAAEHNLGRTVHTVSPSDAQTSDGFQRFCPIGQSPFVDQFFRGPPLDPPVFTVQHESSVPASRLSGCPRTLDRSDWPPS